jgi:hypothetical protein
MTYLVERLQGKLSHLSEAYSPFLEQPPLEEIGSQAGGAAATRDRTAGRKVAL